jgi:hypothetical protein
VDKLDGKEQAIFAARDTQLEQARERRKQNRQHLLCCPTHFSPLTLNQNSWWASDQLIRPEEAQAFDTLQRLLDKNVLTTNEVRQCTVPEIKNVVDKYILGTNVPLGKRAT